MFQELEDQVGLVLVLDDFFEFYYVGVVDLSHESYFLHLQYLIEVFKFSELERYCFKRLMATIWLVSLFRALNTVAKLP